MTEGSGTTRCYACLAEAPTAARDCPRCGAMLQLTAARRNAGIAYVLNSLQGLVASGTIDEEAAARIEADILAPPPASVRAPATVSVASAPSPAGSVPEVHLSGTDRADVFRDQTPSLLLYAGAFLIVVAALIFVNVSGDQIPDPLKLALMVGGTLGFLAAGIACHRWPRVVDAGRTFLMVGALLVPIDVVATYALFIRESPMEVPLLWLWGSLFAALLYAALAIAGFGVWYSRLFALATVSATIALLETGDAASGWSQPVLMALAVAQVAAWRWARGANWGRLTTGLLAPAQIVAGISLAVALLTAVMGELFGGQPDRLPIALTVILATANYALHTDRTAPRWMALLTAGLSVLAVLYAADAPNDAYVFALVGLAWVYAAVGWGAESFRPLERIPEATRSEVRLVAALWGSGALIFDGSDAPATRAFAYLAIAGLAAAIALVSRPGQAASRPRFDEIAVGLSALLLHVGIRYAFAARPGGSSLLFGVSGDQAALVEAVFLGSLILFVTTAAAHTRAHRLRDALAVSSALSIAAVVALADEPMQRTLFAAAYAVALAAAAIAGRDARVLRAAGALGAVAMLGALEWYGAPRDIWPTVLTVVAGVVYAAALRPGAPSPYARALRESAIGLCAVGAATGCALIAEDRSASGDAWRATEIALVGTAVLLAAESRARRMYGLAVAASAVAIFAVLTEITFQRPTDAQAYTAPLGAYLVVVSLLSLRYGPDSWRPHLGRVEAAGGIVLLAPTYAAMWDPDGFGHGVRLVAEAFVLIAIGVVMRRRVLVATALGFLGLAALRALVDLTERIPNWLLFGTSGALLLAVGFVLLLRREHFVRWQRRVLELWERWGASAPTT